MTDSISRRDLVVLAGAGLAASCCGERETDLIEDCTKAAEKARGKPVLIASAGDPWGADPHDAPPSGGKNHYPAFTPAYIALLYLGFGKDWKIRVNQASYKLNGEDSLEKARSIFLNMVGVANKRFKHVTKDIYTRTVTNKGNVDSESFDDFKFKSQTELFIFLHSTSVELDPNVLISFSSLTQAGEAGAPNYSFFNASPVEGADLGDLKKHGRMIRMQNLVTKYHGDKIETEQNIPYSMNIHFTLPGINAVGGKGPRLPMVFDPDTGNGQGNEP